MCFRMFELLAISLLQITDCSRRLKDLEQLKCGTGRQKIICPVSSQSKRSKSLKQPRRGWLMTNGYKQNERTSKAAVLFSKWRLLTSQVQGTHRLNSFAQENRMDLENTFLWNSSKKHTTASMTNYIGDSMGA